MGRTHDRRGFIVKSGIALAGGLGVLGAGQAAQASTRTAGTRPAGMDASTRKPPPSGDSSLPPLNVRIANQDGNTITLAWDEPAGYEQHLYEFMVSDNGSLECFGTRTGVTMKRLRSGTTHELTVVYQDDPNLDSNPRISPPSSPVRVALAPSSDTTPPTAPTNARVIFDPNIISFNLYWDPSTDNVTPQADLQYDMVFDDGSCIYDIPMGESVYNENGFVRAVDAAGNRSALSNRFTS